MGTTPHTFLVAANNPVPVSDAQALGLPADAEMTSTIRLATARRPEDTPLARVFAARSAPRRSRSTPPPFWLHGGPDGRPWCSVHPAAPDTHDVHTPDGALLARISRRPGRLLPWPRRVRWSVRFTDTPRQVTGKEGTWYSWLVHVVTAPAWILFTLFALLYAFFDGTTDDHSFSQPARTRWLTPGAGTLLDYRGVREVYRLAPRGLDVRLAYALAVLQTWERKRGA
ncbi:hypothetical protein [Streptomyces sp. AC555_RSS877]|uniref:hypothetical protein n=1 Tax=Streptomyces sp. AC555_RSS877 TaxID=2823688 RepID=UPI0027E46569|nr:hypothetical protein [Streptomyces sp. AC555_RSS877]